MFLLPTYPIFFQHVIGNRLFFLFGLSGTPMNTATFPYFVDANSPFVNITIYILVQYR